MEYKPFTKGIINKSGKEEGACIFFGTDKCHIHTKKCVSCMKCDLMKAILTQLHHFEKAYMEVLNN